MSEIYDNWERVVAATLNREKLRELALLSSSSETSHSSSGSTTSHRLSFVGTSGLFNIHFNFKYFNSPPPSQRSIPTESSNHYVYPIGGILDRIDLGIQVMQAADRATFFRKKCSELKSETQELVSLLRKVARANQTMYGCPTRRIMDGTGGALRRALELVSRCRGWRVFAKIPGAAFPPVLSELKLATDNLSWLLRDDHKPFGRPPIAADEPALYYIWELIAILKTGSIHGRRFAAGSLASLASQDEFYRKLIVEEGGVQPLLRLLMDGIPDVQENAAKAIGWLGKDIVRGSSFLCRQIAGDPSALLNLALLMEHESIDIRENSASLLVDITTEAENDVNPTGTSSERRDDLTTFVNHLYRLMGKKDSEIFVVIACIRTVGNLARVIGETETWIIQLVKLRTDTENSRIHEEVSVAINKFSKFNKFITMQAQCEAISSMEPTVQPQFLVEEYS